MKSVAEINQILTHCIFYLKKTTEKFKDLDVDSFTQRLDALIRMLKCPHTASRFQAMDLQRKSKALKHLEKLITLGWKCTEKQGKLTYDTEFLVAFTKLPMTLSSIEELLKLSHTLASLDNVMELPRTSAALESITKNGDTPIDNAFPQLPKSSAALREIMKFPRTFDALDKIMTEGFLSAMSIAPKVDAVLESALNELRQLPSTAEIVKLIEHDNSRSDPQNDALQYIRELATTNLPIDEITLKVDEAVSAELLKIHVYYDIEALPKTLAALESLEYWDPEYAGEYGDEDGDLDAEKAVDL